MNQDWQNFLALQGAQIQEGLVNRFGDAAAERIATRDGTVICDLGQYGMLRVSGEEAETFLQNLLSNDIREVSGTRAQFSSLNTAKGRMLATLLIWREGDNYLLQLPRVLCDPIRKRLGMYVLRAKVMISDVSDELVTLGLSGTNTLDSMHRRFGELPLSPLDCINTGQCSITRIEETRWQINTTPQQAQMLWKDLSATIRPVGSSCWDWLNIRSGIPVILPQTQEQFVAQMVNFDQLHGVNFKKGCYPGQEIVARTQYLGKQKKRMYLAHVDSEETPLPGDELFNADMEGQSCGMIVNAADAPSGGFDVLAVVQISSHDAHLVHLGSLQGATFAFEQLPYPLP